MTLDVIIPIYNEEDTLAELLEKVLASPLRPTVIAVNDGSSDSTPEILRHYGNRERIRFASHERNLGKGAAVRTGIGMATGDVVLVQDADLEYDPDDFSSILEPFEDPDVMVVYGSRRLNPTNKRCSRMFLLGGASLTWLTNLLYGTGITDEPTCYKAFRRELLQSLPLRCMGFEFCPEVTALVARRGIRIREVPIRYNPRSRAEGKKIGLSDWFRAVLTLLRYRLLPESSIAARPAGQRG
ncbi:MAG: glycosyltransferase family 2 protein [Candidatus Eisenbacteria bacterium]